MNHSFNTEVAELYGVEEAIIIENIYFWILKNKANDKHFHDECYWTYNSARAFTELFPYWTERQLERILKNAESKGAIKTGVYNKIKYDRTKWYSVTDEVIDMYENTKKDKKPSTKRVNGNTQNVEPIPDINTDINKNNNENYYSEEVKQIKELLTDTSKLLSAEVEDSESFLHYYADTDKKPITFINSLNNPVTADVTDYIKLCSTPAEAVELAKKLPEFLSDGIRDGSFINKKTGEFAIFSFAAFKNNSVLFERLKNY